MPAWEGVGIPPGHSLVLFSTDHPARNEIDRALALVADPGAAADVHQFRLSTKRKQDLFACMRDLDIAWNDWLAEAEGIDTWLRMSNISSRIYPFLPQPLPRGLDIYHIDEPGSNDRRFRAHLDHLEGLAPLPIPPRPSVALPSGPTRNPPLRRPALHDEEPQDTRCLYCDAGHTARLCPRPHVLCTRLTRCLILVHHPGFGSPCSTRVVYSPCPEPYDWLDPKRIQNIRGERSEGEMPSG
ncbi:hypothetical protein EDB87DRAFT_1735075 [Lactarius vividus]|nr:hypothetical protein EDB87DRAFT_1735075 [Lactarius vividus]